MTFPQLNLKDIFRVAEWLYEWLRSWEAEYQETRSDIFHLRTELFLFNGNVSYEEIKNKSHYELNGSHVSPKQLLSFWFSQNT